MVNFTVDGSTFSFPASLLAPLVTVNIFLSVTATLGNALILIALHKEASLHPPTKLLFRCLAVTDLCVGFISQPLFVSFIFRISNLEINAANVKDDVVISIFSYTLCGVSVATSSSISVDRLLALSLGLRYRQFVSLSRVRALLVSFWLTAISSGLTRFWEYRMPMDIAIVLGSLCAVISIFSHINIRYRLNQHQAQVQDRLQQGKAHKERRLLEIARYKKTVSSIAWVQLALLICYVPFVTVSILLKVVLFTRRIYIVWLFSATLVYLNSTLNPILYCWKIRDVRQRVKEAVSRQLLRLFN